MSLKVNTENGRWAEFWKKQAGKKQKHARSVPMAKGSKIKVYKIGEEDNASLVPKNAAYNHKELMLIKKKTRRLRLGRTAGNDSSLDATT